MKMTLLVAQKPVMFSTYRSISFCSGEYRLTPTLGPFRARVEAISYLIHLIPNRDHWAFRRIRPFVERVDVRYVL